MPPSNSLRNSEKKQQSSKPASVLFSQKQLPSIGNAIAIGYYPRGCLQGGVELPVTGPTWQVMRVSRNRDWGIPNWWIFWNVLCLSQRKLQARTAFWWVTWLSRAIGHRSHHVDIWFMPMPDRVLRPEERDNTTCAIRVWYSRSKSLEK
jgi:penicillin-insensitive murein endopeptidase